MWVKIDIIKNNFWSANWDFFATGNHKEKANMPKIVSPGFLLNLTKSLQEMVGRYIIVMANSPSPLLCFPYIQILEKACIQLYIKNLRQRASMIIIYAATQFVNLYHSVLKKL